MNTANVDQCWTGYRAFADGGPMVILGPRGIPSAPPPRAMENFRPGNFGPRRQHNINTPSPLHTTTSGTPGKTGSLVGRPQNAQ